MRTSYGPLSRLISAKVTLLMLLSFSIGIIFLEARLYSVGSTVFGLLSVAALFGNCSLHPLVGGLLQ